MLRLLFGWSGKRSILKEFAIAGRDGLTAGVLQCDDGARISIGGARISFGEALMNQHVSPPCPVDGLPAVLLPPSVDVPRAQVDAINSMIEIIDEP